MKKAILLTQEIVLLTILICACAMFSGFPIKPSIIFWLIIVNFILECIRSIYLC